MTSARSPLPRARGTKRRVLRLAMRFGLVTSAATLLVGVFLWACSSSNEAPPSLGTTPAPPVSSAAVLDCTQPNTGCPCSQPGESMSCGHVVSQSKDYTSCSLGTRTCASSGKWGQCVGSQVITINSWQVSAHLLDQPTPVSADSICDPSLYEIGAVLGTNDASLDDGGVSVLEGGAITLTANGTGGSPVAYGCPADGGALAISPATSNLVLTKVASPPTPNTVQFAANLSGCTSDASVSAIWTVDQPSYAIVTNTGLLTMEFPYVGPINVTAYAGSLSGTAVVNVTVNAVDTSTVDAALATSFASTCGATDAGGGG